jgi:hypothetical protein
VPRPSSHPLAHSRHFFLSSHKTVLRLSSHLLAHSRRFFLSSHQSCRHFHTHRTSRHINHFRLTAPIRAAITVSSSPRVASRRYLHSLSCQNRAESQRHFLLTASHRATPRLDVETEVPQSIVSSPSPHPPPPQIASPLFVPLVAAKTAHHPRLRPPNHRHFHLAVATLVAPTRTIICVSSRPIVVRRKWWRDLTTRDAKNVGAVLV